MTTDGPADLMAFTTRLASAYFSRNAVVPDQIAQVIGDIHGSLGALGREQPEADVQRPAVPIKKSVTPDYLVCLEDGKQLKMLKRHLRTTYDLTPEQYRAKWGLRSDYPMVAPNYARQRSEFAKKIGLGTTATPARRRGRGKAAVKA
ncbi:MAG: MucR family transcriptional regulator [Bauldia litoralis]